MSSRNLVFVFVTAIKTIFCIGFAFGQDELASIKTIERITTAVIPIICGKFIGESSFQAGRGIGTAFFINEQGYFLTARHVIEDLENSIKIDKSCIPSIYIILNDSTNMRVQPFTFKNYIKDSNIDIAVCKPDTNPFAISFVKNRISFVTFGRFKRIKDGTYTIFTGFPLNFPLPVTSKGHIASYFIEDKQIVLDDDAWPGVSGSPVYLDNGKVIGIIIKGISEISGLTFVQPNEAIFKFLSENNISFYKDE